MKGVWMVIISGFLAGIIAGGGALIAVGMEIGDAPIAATKGWTWLVIAVTALVAAAKDWRTYSAKPPGNAAPPSPVTKPDK